MAEEGRVADVPVYRKILLTLEEASALSGVGVNRLRELSRDPDFASEVVCLIGRRRYYRRRRLEEYLDGFRGVV